jgi:hypothetical protein
MTFTWVLTALVPQSTIGFRHFARIDARDLADPGGEAAERRIDADGGVEARILLRMAQPVDAVAHDETHGAGIVVRPHGFGAVTLLGPQQSLGRDVESVLPRRGDEFAAPFRALAAQRRREPVPVVHPLGVAGDLGADHPGRVVIVRGAVNASDGAGV